MMKIIPDNIPEGCKPVKRIIPTPETMTARERMFLGDFIKKDARKGVLAVRTDFEEATHIAVESADLGANVRCVRLDLLEERL